MTQEEKRIKLAEFAGWEGIVASHKIGYAPYRKEPYSDRVNACPVNDLDCIPLDPLPDYFSDLNAVHELVMSQPKEVRSRFRVELQWLITKPCKVSGIQLNAENYDQWFHATAAQRCEALGLTLNLWK